MVSGCANSNIEKEVYYKGNLIINEDQDFNQGHMENTKITTEGEIILEDSLLSGKYTSPIIRTENFNSLVASWNVNTPEASEIEVFVQVRVDNHWTKWYSYGVWSLDGNRASVRGQSDEVARMSIDTLDILGDKKAEALRYCIDLRRESLDTPSPQVRNIFMTLRLVDQVQEDLPPGLDYLVDLKVPERSQMVVPEIGRVICSPTCVSMVLEYYGVDLETEEVAEKVLDKGPNIYGNWSYNVAYAGTLLDYSYVARFPSINGIKEKISEGIPVIASIKIKTKEELTGAPQAYPGGHLILIRGFTIKDGEEYVIVNDPASKEVEKVRREYKVSEFENAWSKIVYILTNKN